MSEKLPVNFTAVWHRGDFSIGEVYTRKIIDGYPMGSTYHQERYIRDEKHQLPEESFRELWTFAIGLCGLKPDHVVSFYRQDKEDEVPENDNNRPFRPNVAGQETKDIIYEGTIYHSDMSEIRKFDIKDIAQKSRAVKRKERKEKRKR